MDQSSFLQGEEDLLQKFNRDRLASRNRSSLHWNFFPMDRKINGSHDAVQGPPGYFHSFIYILYYSRMNCSFIMFLLALSSLNFRVIRQPLGVV
ncbi:protein of unknown function [Candidatus Nitrospira inopinata]|uniref:Uncharacterized protein n=1 Tax=Candidatus Nitrospira inopinata TaxID=1715989 RepID=A0A0S4KUX1_9BACT|nr:protein of unknown function [Candidatus Nitrospira inopinata]